MKSTDTVTFHPVSDPAKAFQIRSDVAHRLRRAGTIWHDKELGGYKPSPQAMCNMEQYRVS